MINQKSHKTVQDVSPHTTYMVYFLYVRLTDFHGNWF
jgi:hypothetical protein